MIDVDKFKKLKSTVAALQSEKDRAEGGLTQLMTKLKEEFGCVSLKGANKLLKKLEDEDKAAEEAYDEASKAFEEEFGDELGLGEEESD